MSLDSFSTFNTRTNTLSDGSSTSDVWLSDDYGQTIVACPASQLAAEHCADILNAVRNAYETATDREAVALTQRLTAVLELLSPMDFKPTPDLLMNLHRAG